MGIDFQRQMAYDLFYICISFKWNMFITLVQKKANETWMSKLLNLRTVNRMKAASSSWTSFLICERNTCAFPHNDWKLLHVKFQSIVKAIQMPNKTIMMHVIIPSLCDHSVHIPLSTQDLGQWTHISMFPSRTGHAFIAGLSVYIDLLATFSGSDMRQCVAFQDQRGADPSTLAPTLK